MTAIDLELPEKLLPLMDPHPYKGIHGGRGSAKSWSVARVVAAMGSQRPIRAMFCREVQRSIGTSIKRLLDDQIDMLGLRHLYRSTQYSIVGRQVDTEFMFAGLRTNPESIKSTEGLDLVVIEEADKVSQTSLDLLPPTLRKEGSELWAIWNRRNENDPIDRLFLGPKGPPPNSLVVEMNWHDNPWFTEKLRAEMEWMRRTDHDKYLHIWGGKPVQRSDSKVFTNWRVDDIDDRVPEDAIPRFGADWGYSVDPTVLVKCYVWDRTLYIREEAWAIGCETIDTPRLFDGVSEARLFPVVADSARPETISHMRNHDYPLIRGARKGAGSIADGIGFMQSYEIVVHPSCEHVEDEIGNFSFLVDPHTDEVTNKLQDRKNHTIDSVRYALEAYRRAADDYEGSGIESAPILVRSSY